MTKVSIFGVDPKIPTEKKRIKLVKSLTNKGEIKDTSMECSEYENTSLYYKGQPFDIILCWDDVDPNEREVFLGHWNDGVV